MMDPMMFIIAICLLIILMQFESWWSLYQSANYLELPSDPNGSHVIEMVIEPTTPDAHTWRWKVYFTGQADRGVSGTKRDHGDACAKARSVADKARARYVAEQSRRARIHTERLPL